MKKQKSKLLFSVVSFVLVTALLAGSTLEIYPNGFSIFGKKFLDSNTLYDFGIKLYWSDSSDGDWNEAASGTVPFSSKNDKNENKKNHWEPGHTEIKYFRVKNDGEIDFDYELKIDTSEESDFDYEGELADVIDVYVVSYTPGSESDKAKLSSLISDSNKIGTLADCFSSAAFFATVSNDDSDNLAVGKEKAFAVGFKMRTDAGNEYQRYTDEYGKEQNRATFTISASAYASGPEPVADGLFGLTFATYDNYQENTIYRVGNNNAITVSSLFIGGENSSSVDSSKVSFEWVSKQSYFGAKLTHTANTSDWTAGTLKFTGEGVGTLWLKYDGTRAIGIDLEVLTAKNFTDSTSFAATSIDAVLLKDISTTGTFQVSNGHALYGNGFIVEQGDGADTTGGTAFCTMYGGTLDNVHIKGLPYSSFNKYTSTSAYFKPCVRASSSTYYRQNYIYNSHISDCSNALIVSAETHMDNTLVSGGAVSSIDLVGGNLYMNDCETSLSLYGGSKGLAIFVESQSAHITLNGTLKQYNWVTKSDFPSTYRSYISDLYSDKTYAYTRDGSTYINLGILCAVADSSVDIDETVAKTIITDNTSNDYSYKTEDFSSYTATCYMQNAPSDSSYTISLGSYELEKQSPTVPASEFNIKNVTSNPNYKALTDVNSSFCKYDTKSGLIQISPGSDSAYNWDPMILPVTKYKNSVSYTVTMNGTDYTNKKIPFSTPGKYTVEYNFTDSEYYYKNADGISQGSVSYKKTLTVFVIGAKAPTFTYKDGYTAKMQVINGEIYVMPDTTESLVSKTVNNVAVYMPTVNMNIMAEDGSSYSSGKGASYTPPFYAVTITDYNLAGDTVQYTYNTSTTTWPHGQDASKGPDTSVFGYATGEDAPYVVRGDGYEGFGKNDYGLCYKRTDLDGTDTVVQTESSKIVHWYYVGDNGLTYNYYTKYVYAAFSYKLCFASGTEITMADGSQKPIEQVKLGDKVMSWNFYNGESEAKEVCLLVDHGESECEVINLEFSDGTVLRFINEHGIYDYDTNDFVYINGQNCQEYTGHRFVQYKSGGSYKNVKLTKAYVTTEVTHAYSIATADNLNAFADGMLTLTPPGDYYNPIEKGSKLKYDKEKLAEDINRYGLYTYDDFKDYLTPYQFYAFNVDYMKVPVSKGQITYEYILELIEGYSKYFG